MREGSRSKGVDCRVYLGERYLREPDKVNKRL
jgi:hypothetical protein